MPLPSAGPADCSAGLSKRIFDNYRYDNVWKASQGGYAVGVLGCPTAPNGFGYRVSAVTTGITGSVQPTWPTTIGNTVVDGGVTWTCDIACNPSGKGANHQYVFLAGDLDALRVMAYDTARAVADEFAADNEAWTAVGSFSNSWAAFAGTTPSYRKNSAGMVLLKGRVASGTMGTVAFTLPAGYRPGDLKLFAVRGPSGTFATVLVGNDGTVVPNDGTNADISLDGCIFQAEM